MKTILVADPDPHERDLCSEQLSEDGYHVVCAKDGLEALQNVREAHPDLVVLDINLPHMDGLEVIGHILDEQPQLPVIINTAYCSYRDNFMSWAADAFVCKSSDLSELKARIRETLNKSRDLPN